MKKFIKFLSGYGLAILTMSIFVGCSENVESVDVGPSYLSISSEKSLSEFTLEEWDILNEARSRIDVTINSDKLMVITQQLGSEVNISEHLFQKIKLMIENGNKIISEACQTTTRMSGDDCVANCIVELGRRLGGTLNAPLVRQWVHNQCKGIGVPEGRACEMADRWLVAKNISIPISTAAWADGPIMAVILGAHAVVVDDLQGQEIRIFDPALVSTDPVSVHDGFAKIPALYVSSAVQATGIRGGN